MFFTKAKDFLLDILFPSFCVNCPARLHENKGCICEECLASLTVHSTLFCAECLRRLPNNRRICHMDSKYLLGAAGNYDAQALKNLIHALKYKRIKGAAIPLAALLTRYGEKLGINLDNYLVLPVPLSPKRRRERGFNQAELLAREFANHFTLTLAADALEKTKNTPPQARAKNKKERYKNLAGCFRVKNREEVRGKNVIVIDDVFTSGATMNEACRTLKEAGAKKILAVVAAKA